MMQQHEEGLDGSQQQRENALRQKRFALVLAGDDRVAEMLVERLAMSGNALPNTALSASALQFYQFKKLYELWASEARQAPRAADIFQPGRENDAIQKGLDPSIAKVMGELPSLHRALLLLIYGENFSYAATAQLLNISIEELMSALAAARHKFSDPEQAATVTGQSSAPVSSAKVAHDAA